MSIHSFLSLPSPSPFFSLFSFCWDGHGAMKSPDIRMLCAIKYRVVNEDLILLARETWAVYIVARHFSPSVFHHIPFSCSLDWPISRQ